MSYKGEVDKVVDIKYAWMGQKKIRITSMVVFPALFGVCIDRSGAVPTYKKRFIFINHLGGCPFKRCR